MIRIRVGMVRERSQEFEIDKPFDDITTTDIYNVIGYDKNVMGWLEIDEKGNHVKKG